MKGPGNLHLAKDSTTLTGSDPAVFTYTDHGVSTLASENYVQLRNQDNKCLTATKTGSEYPLRWDDCKSDVGQAWKVLHDNDGADPDKAYVLTALDPIYSGSEKLPRMLVGDDRGNLSVKSARETAAPGETAILTVN